MIVLDASVWVSRLVPQDAQHAASRDWLERYLAGGGGLVAPVLLLAEAAGAISRRTGRADLGQQVAEGLLRLPGVRIVAVDRRLGLASAHLAAELGLRGADAVYAALAHALDIPLVTWDEEQRARAGGAVAVYTPDTCPIPPADSS